MTQNTTTRTQLTEKQINVSLLNIDAMINELNEAIAAGDDRSAARIGRHITHEANRIVYGVR